MNHLVLISCIYASVLNFSFPLKKVSILLICILLLLCCVFCFAFNALCYVTLNCLCVCAIQVNLPYYKHFC